MTELNKPIARKTSAIQHEKSRRRRIILSLEPTAKVGVRLEGTRQNFRIDAEVLYSFAVKQHEAKIERRARELARGGVKLRSARAKARKELQGELKS